MAAGFYQIRKSSEIKLQNEQYKRDGPYAGFVSFALFRKGNENDAGNVIDFGSGLTGGGRDARAQILGRRITASH